MLLSESVRGGLWVEHPLPPPCETLSGVKCFLQVYFFLIRQDFVDSDSTAFFRTYDQTSWLARGNRELKVRREKRPLLKFHTTYEMVPKTLNADHVYENNT